MENTPSDALLVLAVHWYDMGYRYTHYTFGTVALDTPQVVTSWGYTIDPKRFTCGYEAVLSGNGYFVIDESWLCRERGIVHRLPEHVGAALARNNLRENPWKRLGDQVPSLARPRLTITGVRVAVQERLAQGDLEPAPSPLVRVALFAGDVVARPQASSLGEIISCFS